jgi:multimeric flavodoxin WrbA
VHLTLRNTIALFSSSRRNGNTGRLMDRIVLELDIEVVELSSLRMAPDDYHHSNRDDDFEPLMERVLQHDQVIFASPIYWYSVSPAMKVFLDRISDFLELPDLLPKGRTLRGKFALALNGSETLSAAHTNVELKRRKRRSHCSESAVAPHIKEVPLLQRTCRPRRRR